MALRWLERSVIEPWTQNSPPNLNKILCYSSLVINNIMSEITKTKPKTKSQRGGNRPGGGRPKGSTTRITAIMLLDAAEQVVGKSFITSLMEGYRASILCDDVKTRVIYEKMILDKVAVNIVDVEVTDSEETVLARQAAFTEAIQHLAGIKKKD